MAMNGLCQSILYNDLSIILVPKHHHSLSATVGANPRPPEPTAIEIKYHVSFLRLTVELDPNYPTLAFASSLPSITSRVLQLAIWPRHCCDCRSEGDVAEFTHGSGCADG